MSNSTIFKKSVKNVDNVDDVNTTDLQHELGALQSTLAKKKKEFNKNKVDNQLGGVTKSSKSSKPSKKSSKPSKKSSKPSKKSSKSSKKSSKSSKKSSKSSKKSSKSSKPSKMARMNPVENMDVMDAMDVMGEEGKQNSKKSGSKQKRELPPALKASQQTNKKISEKLGYNISPGLIKFVSKFRIQAKQGIKDEKDYVAVNKKTLELFDDYLNKNGKAKLVSEVEKLAEEIKVSRKKNSKTK